MNHPTHICRNCLSQVRPMKNTPGTFFLELVLWILFILPGILYSVWRISARKYICPMCRSDQLVPLNSPAAAMLQKNITS